MTGSTRLFYQYSGTHSLLIGLLPFFLPALMWLKGQSLSQISSFIAVNGIGYLLTLYYWDRIRIRFGWNWLLVATLILELALVGSIVLDQDFTAINLIALLNGAYGCFFWMAQRTLFAHCTNSSDTGVKFGNFQIVVMVLLKTGILVGGYLWEKWGASSVFLVTVCIVVPAITYYSRVSLPESLMATAPAPITLNSIAGFRDSSNSRVIFLIDGFFLFAESYFWVITLYIISGENLVTLGVLVVSLSIVLAVLFYLIKNRLDKIRAQQAYVIGVLGYVLSWLLRGAVETGESQYWVYPLIVFIAFLTALFRLVFNKRFFDLAAKADNHRYIVLKSYYSQLGVAVLFAITALALLEVTEPLMALKTFYWVLAPLALIYLLYRLPPKCSSRHYLDR